jgi:hypothetical protein
MPEYPTPFQWFVVLTIFLFLAWMVAACEPCKRWEDQDVTTYPFIGFAGSNLPGLRAMAWIPQTQRQRVCVE